MPLQCINLILDRKLKDCWIIIQDLIQQDLYISLLCSMRELRTHECSQSDASRDEWICCISGRALMETVNHLVALGAELLHTAWLAMLHSCVRTALTSMVRLRRITHASPCRMRQVPKPPSVSMCIERTSLVKRVPRRNYQAASTKPTSACAGEDTPCAEGSKARISCRRACSGRKVSRDGLYHKSENKEDEICNDSVHPKAL